MGSKSDAPKPDPNIGLAQSQMAEIARQQLDFSREAYYAEQPRLDRYADLADEFVRLQGQAQEQQSKLTADYQQRMQGTFYPIEDTLAFDALGYYDASPEQQAKLEAAYLAQNKSLVNQRFDEQLARTQADDLARRQSFEKQLGGLAMDPVTSAGYTAEKPESGISGFFSRFFGGGSGDGTTVSYTPQDLAQLDGSIGSSIKAQQDAIKDMESRLAGVKQDSATYRALAPQLSAAKQNLSKLTAFKDSFGDYLTVDPESNMTLADKAAQARLGGLQTQRERELGNVGSSLDTVRAYAETYKSGQEQQAGMARQDVANQFDQRNQQLQRQLRSFGVDPTSGRFAAQSNQNAIMQAASEAQAMNQARQAAKQLGWAKRMDAAGLGRGLPGSQATSAGLAMNLGQGGLQGQSSVTGLNQQVNGALMSGLGAAGGSWGNIGQLGLATYQQQSANTNAANAANAQLIGGLAGAAAGGAGAYFGAKA